MSSISALSQVALPAAPTASGQAANKAYVDQGMRSVSSLASITSPVTGQLALLTTDLMIYRYTGSAWLGVLHTAPGGGFARYERATGQPINSSAPTKLALTTAVSTHADISANGTFDVFTLNRGGTWRVEGTVAYPTGGGGTGRTLWVASATDTARTDLMNLQPNPNWITVPHITSTFTATAGQQVALWTYQDTGGQVTTDVTQIKASISLKWEGP